MKYSIIFVVFLLSGCISKNPFVTEKQASSANLSEGYINKNAPIIREPKRKAIFIPQKYANKTEPAYQKEKQENKIEMVGYIIYGNKDVNTGLYYYTFTNALRSQKIQFFSKNPIRYSPNQLVRVKVVDNYLVEYQPYKTIVGKRRFNNYIKSAKEYFIKLN